MEERYYTEQIEWILGDIHEVMRELRRIDADIEVLLGKHDMLEHDRDALTHVEHLVSAGRARIGWARRDLVKLTESHYRAGARDLMINADTRTRVGGLE